MPLDPNSPVLVGLHQILQRVDAQMRRRSGAYSLGRTNRKSPPSCPASRMSPYSGV